jgi:acyl carrier protein
MSGREVRPADIVLAIAAAIGEQSVPATAATLLEGDLWLDSLDVAALGAVLRDRYGPAVDLVGYVAGLDIDEIIGLSVGDVARYVDRCQ